MVNTWPGVAYRDLKADSGQRQLEQQLRSYLLRLPSIESLQFFDGTPFADQSTLGWINSTVLVKAALITTS